MRKQPPLFEDYTEESTSIVKKRSGTFLDNMSLPIHRWFRYSAGFSADWVKSVLRKWEINERHIVLDPFVGSGTVSIACDSIGVQSIGIEAHPFVARIGNAKLKWLCDPQKFKQFAKKTIIEAKNKHSDLEKYSKLIIRSYSNKQLEILDRLKSAWFSLDDSSSESELTWLALTAILRRTARAGTAQWQYILPNKTKVNVVDPIFAFQQQVDIMFQDLKWMQENKSISKAVIINKDSRILSEFLSKEIDVVITSPPYANNYDYADALRFEMTFWGEIENWSDLHNAVRKYLLVSSSQHSSREKIGMDELISCRQVRSIQNELKEVMEELSVVRLTHGGRKHYHTMIGAYFRDISLVLEQLRKVCKNGVHQCWVIGDSAPYGVYCPVDKWIGELALANGYKSYSFEKLRDRNVKWKNRKHRVPLKEGLLWIEG